MLFCLFNAYRHDTSGGKVRSVKAYMHGVAVRVAALTAQAVSWLFFKQHVGLRAYQRVEASLRMRILPALQTLKPLGFNFKRQFSVEL